jgi:hypothetical protein
LSLALGRGKRERKRERERERASAPTFSKDNSDMESIKENKKQPEYIVSKQPRDEIDSVAKRRSKIES